MIQICVLPRNECVERCAPLYKEIPETLVTPAPESSNITKEDEKGREEIHGETGGKGKKPGEQSGPGYPSPYPASLPYPRMSYGSQADSTNFDKLIDKEIEAKMREYPG